MAFKSQLQTSAICNLCKRSQTEHHHEVLSCSVTRRIIGGFKIHFTTILPEDIDDKEMVPGLEIGQNKEKYRKNLGISLPLLLEALYTGRNGQTLVL